MGALRTYNVDPDVNHNRAMVMVAAREGDDEALAHYRQELADARIIAAAKKVAAQLPDLPPEKLEVARAILLGGA